MGWPLFTWILTAGIFSMLYFLYLSIVADEKRWRPVGELIRRHTRHIAETAVLQTHDR